MSHPIYAIAPLPVYHQLSSYDISRLNYLSLRQVERCYLALRFLIGNGTAVTGNSMRSYQENIDTIRSLEQMRSLGLIASWNPTGVRAYFYQYPLAKPSASEIARMGSKEKFFYGVHSLSGLTTTGNYTLNFPQILATYGFTREQCYLALTTLEYVAADWQRDIATRGAITTYLDNALNLIWPEQRGAFSKAELEYLYSSNIFSLETLVLIILRKIRPTTGTINADAIQTDWGINNGQLFEAIATLQRRFILDYSISAIAVNWQEVPLVLSLEKIEADSPTLYKNAGKLLHYLNNLNASRGGLQQINVGAIAASLGIANVDIITQLGRIADLGYWELDLSEVSISWK